ncbi:phosphatase PAP2 family protein [Puniceicoccus vermicola]|uniref:Phosphatase PAP2 family protein n=1 Tax=Puniceicoccus vermicola TaxID=388746 RepID=A0A7X1AZU1_9BACT|nr:phosphatase PAP2 family protein [Puniceicoccus vermicola]MBC2601963.1 phosphatase PAP2 family protein [Puniceicoccus vermicola]
MTADSQSSDRTARRSWTYGFFVWAILLCAGIWGFTEIAEYAMGGDSHAIDRKILLSMRSSADASDPAGPEWLEELGRDFTALGGTGVLTLVTFAVTGYLVLIGKKRVAGFLILSVVLGLVMSSLLKGGFDRPRPDLVPHGSHTYTSSFPSGHSMMAAVCYLTLASLLCAVHTERRIKMYLLSIAFLLTILIGVSRVYLGVHWPTDVVAGWLAGALWAFTAWRIARWFQSRRQLEPPSSSDGPPSE